MHVPYILYSHINIYIVIHRQAVSSDFIGVRYARYFKLGSKPG